MSLRFTKMHGLGNDFMVIDGITQNVTLRPQQICAWANRHTGIGFDQCLLVEKSKQAEFDFYYRIFNQDGQEVGQCGNGARCLALFLSHYGLTNKKHIKVYTRTSSLTLTLNGDKSVSVNMGVPTFSPKDIPFFAEIEQKSYLLPLQQKAVCEVHVVNMGNPHAVCVVPSLEKAPVTEQGAQISTHPWFPEQTNAGFMQIENDGLIKLRVYERGSAETRACGSGACAAAAVGRKFYGMQENIKVSLLGGMLEIYWPSFKEDLILTGPASFVYEGLLLLD
jgi:diaminopimelate epimerase